MTEPQPQEVVTAQTVRAERIELVDARGAVRATLATDQDGQVSVTLADQEGRRRVALVADRTRAGLYFSTASGTTALLLAIADPVALVMLKDHAGQPGVILSVLPDGQRAVVLCDRAGTRPWVGLEAALDPSLGNAAADPTNRAVFTLRPGGEAGLTMRDREGVARTMLAVDASGQTGLGLLDPAGRPVARFELTRDLNARLEFFGPRHTLVWRAPDEP